MLFDDAHIDKMAAHEAFEAIDGFARVIPIENTEKSAYSLRIPLYASNVAPGDVEIVRGMHSKLTKKQF